MSNSGWVVGVLTGLVVAGLASIFLWVPLVVILSLVVGVKAGNVVDSNVRKQIDS